MILNNTLQYISKSIRKDIDIVHFFTRSCSELASQLPKQMSAIRQNGMIWISWPMDRSADSELNQQTNQELSTHG